MFEAKSQYSVKGFLPVVLTLMRMKMMLFNLLKLYMHKLNQCLYITKWRVIKLKIIEY